MGAFKENNRCFSGATVFSACIFYLCIFSSIILFSTYQLQSQTELQFSFGGPQDDFGRMTLQTDDNGFLILGTTFSYGQGHQDILLTRTDSLGNILWSKTFGTTDRDVGYTMKKDHGGGYILIGWVRTTLPSDDDWYILKIDDNGNVLQEKFIGGVPDDEIMNFELTSDGGYLFSGSSRSFSLDGVDIWIVKTDVNLNVQWNRTYTTGISEHSRCILETSDNHFIYLGNRFTSGLSDRNILLMYLSSIGDTVWVKEFGGIPLDDGRSMVIASDGNFLVLGYTDSYGVGGTDILLFKITPAGNVLWARTYGGTGDEEAFHLVSSPAGNHMIAGTTTSFGNGGNDLILLNVDDEGKLIRANTVGGILDEGQAYLSVANDSGYVVSSGTSSYGNGGQDVLIVKTDREGNSCCSREIIGLVEQNINLAYSGISVDISSGMNYPVHTIITDNVNPPSDLLCYSGIKIIGEDTVCSGSGPFRYSLSPQLDFSFQWIIPPGATITSTLGDTVIFVQFGTQAGYIYVIHTNGCDPDPFDSLYVNVISNALVNAGSDESICQGSFWDFNNSSTIPVASSYDSLKWMGGLGVFIDPDMLRPIYYPEAGELGGVTLSLIAYGSSGCGDDTNSMILTIYSKPLVELGNDTIICEGDMIILYPGAEYSSYLWQDGSTQQALSVYNPGFYWVEVIDSIGCVNSDTIFISIQEVPDLQLMNDTTICGEFLITLEAGEGFDHYTWQDGTHAAEYIATLPGIYWVTADKAGCEKSDTVLITEECPSSIWFPNCFTPNWDGRNDRFLPVYENIIQYKIYVFNRWGQQIYESNIIDEGWDGRFKGKDCPDGVYFFLAIFTDNYHSIAKEITGSITLLR